MGLHRERIDLAERRIVIQEVYELSEHEIKPYPKGKTRRGIPITSEFADRLQQWMAEHPPIRCRTRHRGGKPCNGSLLLSTEDGTPQSYANFRRDRWDPTVKAAGLAGLTPHDLRHSYASWLVQRGVPIEQVQDLLGHKYITTTQRYTHLADTQWASVRDALRGVLTPPTQSAPAENQVPDEDSLRAVIERLAVEKPGQWAAVAAALQGPPDAGAGNAAPHLPHTGDHQEGGKIIRLDRWRRSAG